MRTFLHARLQKLTQLLQHSNGLIGRYNQADPNLPTLLVHFLDQAAADCGRLGLQHIEARTVELKAHYLMARRGIDPASLEKQSSHRRELESKTAFRVLMNVSEQLRASVEQDRQALAAAEAQLRPLLLAGVQRGMVTKNAGTKKGPSAQAELDVLWRRLLDDADTGLAAKQLAMTASLADVVLLLGDLLAATAPAPRKTRGKTPAGPQQ